jgi:hypothetical protein
MFANIESGFGGQVNQIMAGENKNEVAAGLSPAPRFACVVPLPQDPGNPAGGGQELNFPFPPFAWPRGLSASPRHFYYIIYDPGCVMNAAILLLRRLLIVYEAVKLLAQVLGDLLQVMHVLRMLRRLAYYVLLGIPPENFLASGHKILAVKDFLHVSPPLEHALSVASQIHSMRR